MVFLSLEKTIIRLRGGMYVLYPIRVDRIIINVASSPMIPHFVTSLPLLFDAIRILNFSVDIVRPMVDVVVVV